MFGPAFLVNPVTQPMYYADTLSRYSEVLNRLGKKDQAADLKSRSEVIINANPDAKPYRAIPYGKFCSQKPKDSE